MLAVQQSDVREAAFAGSFYPGAHQDLRRSITTMLDSADDADISGQVRALICPHAGYLYSGHVAASGYKVLLNQQADIVVVIAPSHRDRFSGASVFTGKAYTTPLGAIEIAHDITNSLITGNDAIQASWHGHRNEHALEVQLPFLQATLGEFTLVPIVLGDQHIHTVRTLAAGLSEALRGRSAIVVASSDLSHYYDDVVARRVDQNTIDLMETFDEARFEDILQCEACGRGAIVTAMMTARELGADQCKILDYRNSGDITGDYSAVVGYTAAALYTPYCN